MADMKTHDIGEAAGIIARGLSARGHAVAGIENGEDGMRCTAKFDDGKVTTSADAKAVAEVVATYAARSKKAKK